MKRIIPRHIHYPSEILSTKENVLLSQIPPLDWTRMAFETLADFIAKVGNIATTYLSGTIQSAQMALNSLADNFFTGVGGLAKFVAGFFTADATGRGKFANLFVNTALIDALAVTNAKIADLAVDSAKIGALAVTTAKIDNLAVTEGKIASLVVTYAKIGDLAVTTAKIDNLAVVEGKIGNLAVTNIKIANGTLEIAKCTSDFSQYSYFEHNRWITSIEALTGYQVSIVGGGAVTTRKNYLKLNSGGGIGASVKVKGYPIVDPNHNPKVKSRSRITVFPDSADYKSRFIDAGIGDFGIAGLFFRFRYDASGNKKIYAYSYDGTNTTIVELQTFSLNTWYILEIRKQGATVLFRIDNVDKTNISTNLPTTLLEDSLHYAQADSETAGAVEFEECYMTVTEDWM